MRQRDEYPDRLVCYGDPITDDATVQLRYDRGSGPAVDFAVNREDMAWVGSGPVNQRSGSALVACRVGGEKAGYVTVEVPANDGPVRFEAKPTDIARPHQSH